MLTKAKQNKENRTVGELSIFILSFQASQHHHYSKVSRALGITVLMHPAPPILVCDAQAAGQGPSHHFSLTVSSNVRV